MSEITIDGIALHWEQRGEGPALLCVHGFAQSSYVWRYLVRGLEGYRVITVDLKGFGASDKPCDGKYGPLDQAELLARFIHELELRDFVLIGHSFGGAVCLQVATRPEVLLRGLVLMDSAALPQPLPYFMRLLCPRLLGEAVVGLSPLGPSARLGMLLAYWNRGAATRDAAREYANATARPGGRRAMLATARQMLPSDWDAFTAGYPQISVPTLIVWGRNDPIVPVGVGERLAQIIPGARLAVIDRCGHCPQEERPEQTLELLRPFLDSLFFARAPHAPSPSSEVSE